MKKLSSNSKTYLLSIALFGMANGCFDAVFNFRLLDIGFTKTTIGKVYFIAMSIMSMSVLPIIIYSRKLLNKFSFVIYSSVYCISMITMNAVITQLGVKIILSCISIGMIGMLSTGNALFSVNLSEKERDRFFSYFFFLYLTSAMLGSFVARQILTIFGNEQGISISLITAGCFTGLMVLIRIQAVRGLELTQSSSLKTQTIVKNNHNIWLIGLASIFMGASITLAFRFTNIIFESALNFTVAETTTILGCEKLFGIAGALIAPYIVPKLKIQHKILSVSLMIAVALLIQSFTTIAAVFTAAYFIRFGLNYILMPSVDAFSLSKRTCSNALLASCARQFGFYAGGAASAYMYGWILDSYTYQDAIKLSSAFAICGGVTLYCIRKEKTTSEAETEFA